MLGKDSDTSEESSVTISNTENVDTNTSAGNSGENGVITQKENSDSFNSGTELNSLKNKKQVSDAGEEEIADKWAVPEGYQFLPEHLFKFNGIPPPLVSSSWLKLFNSDEEESGEDSIPLARLKKIIRKKKRFKKVDESATSVNSNGAKEQKPEKRKKKKECEYSPINRKRGRPKKQVTENVIASRENEFESEDPDPFWNDESDASNHAVENSVEVDVEDVPNNETALPVNYNEHDYFKPVENEPVKKPEVVDKKEKNKKKNRKKKAAIQGVKMGDSRVSFPCLECGKSFSAASTLKSHQRIHNGTLLICPECHKGFVNKYLLKCHMRIHTGDLLMCHKCGRGFITAELLKVHSRAHTGDRPFVCNICGKSFPTSSNMLQHKQSHNSKKKFLCSQCGSSFVQKRCLDYHMLTHAEKKNICSVCGKLWARKSDLIEHMRVHTGVKPYCCSICPQKFSQASSLKRHQLVHMDVKPIQCVTCNKMFKCQEYYKRHLRKHKNEEFLYNDL